MKKYRYKVKADDALQHFEGALNKEAKKGWRLFSCFYDGSQMVAVMEYEIPSKKTPNRILKILVEDLDLSVRARKGLASLHIRTVQDLIGKTSGELLRARNFGEICLTEIREKLQDLGLKLMDSR